MKTKKINIPIYFGRLVIHQDKNWNKINKKYDCFATKSFEAFVFDQEKKSGRKEIIACFGKNPSQGVIAHEAVHVVNNIFKNGLMKLDEENDENQAYLTGWVVSEINKFVKIKK